MIRPIARRLMTRFYRPLLQRYLLQERRFRIAGLDLLIGPGVFHPGFFGSSLALLQYLEGRKLRGKKVLDVGCGSGLLGLAAARQGAQVTAVDISPSAVANTRRNAVRNGLVMKVVASDLFQALEAETYDLILVNPPFFEGSPSHEAGYAWYCGTGFDYFRRFFATLPAFTHSQTDIRMVLSEVCELDKISGIGQDYGVKMTVAAVYPRCWEKFLIYELRIT